MQATHLKFPVNRACGSNSLDNAHCVKVNSSTYTALSKVPARTVPLETMGPFAAILPRSNRDFDLQFHLGKTASNRIKNVGFT